MPSSRDPLERLLRISQESFGGSIQDQGKAEYLFVLEDQGTRRVIGTSLIVARHGTLEQPHLYFEVDEVRDTLKLVSETTGRTELGGLILEPAFRSHPAKLGKRLSLARLLYMRDHSSCFCPDVVAELLPRFTEDGKAPLWEVLGRPWTGMDYREADEMARRDKSFVTRSFPSGAIPMSGLPPEVRSLIGKPGPATEPVARILTEVGFHYLHQVDPFDGGPHYGAKLGDIHFEKVEILMRDATEVTIIL